MPRRPAPSPPLCSRTCRRRGHWCIAGKCICRTRWGYLNKPPASRGAHMLGASDCGTPSSCSAGWQAGRQQGPAVYRLQPPFAVGASADKKPPPLQTRCLCMSTWKSPPADADVAVAGLVLLDDHATKLAQLCRHLQLQRLVRAAREACARARDGSHGQGAWLTARSSLQPVTGCWCRSRQRRLVKDAHD